MGVSFVCVRASLAARALVSLLGSGLPWGVGRSSVEIAGAIATQGVSKMCTHNNGVVRGSRQADMFMNPVGFVAL